MTIAGVIRALAGHVRRHGRLALLIGIGLFVDAAYYAVLPMAFKLIIDEVLGAGRASVVVNVLLVVLVAIAVASAVGVWRDRLYARLSSLVTNDLRRALFERLQRLGLDFYARMGSGQILGRFSTDLAAVESALVSSLPNILICGMSLAISTALLAALEWQLAVIAVVGLPLCVIGPRLFNARADRGSYELGTEEAQSLGLVSETVRNQPAIKAFGLGGAQRATYEAQLRRVLAANVRFQFWSSLVVRTPVMGATLVQLAVVAYGTHLALDGAITVGTLAAAFALLENMTACITEMTTSLPALLQSSGGLQRIDELLAERPSVAEARDALEAPSPAREIALEGVRLGYGDRTVLDGLDLTFPVGASVALVGPSGSGKSTVLALLLRFVDPAGGRVAIDGVDVRAFTQDSLRARIGTVLQEPYLFAATIRENIAAGRPDASEREIVAAARAAGIHEEIAALPAGYDTPLADGGGGLSGGQRQRVAIARALVRDPPILLLDEATSALDPASEAAVTQTLLEQARGRTTITVTHRLGTVRDADAIVVLERGRVVEQGTHEELLRDADGLYRALWDKQQGLTLTEHGASIDLARLRRIELLQGIDDDVGAELAERFETERLPAGRVVVGEGDEADRFYVVVRGTLAVTQRAADRSTRAIATLHDGDSFGEIALLRDTVRTSTVTTTAPTVLLSLSRASFARAVERDPVLRERVGGVADERLAADRLALGEPPEVAPI